MQYGIALIIAPDLVAKLCLDMCGMHGTGLHVYIYDVIGPKVMGILVPDWCFAVNICAW